MHDESVRYELSDSQTSALLGLMGVVPDGRFVAASETSTPPLSVLEGSGLVGEAGTEPVPALGAAMRVVAAPSRVLSVRVGVPGVEEWAITHVAAGPNGGPYVMIAALSDGLDLLVMASEYEVAALLDGLLDLTTLPTRPVSPDVTVPFDGWIGLLAATDVHRSTALTAQLERRPTPTPQFDADALQAQVTAGLGGSDTRWAVTAFTPLSPFDLRSAPPDGPAMVSGMTEAKLVEPAGNALQPTVLGSNLVELCGEVIKWSSVTLTFADGDPAVRMGELTILRSPVRLGLGFWNGEDGAREVTLVEPEAEVAVEMLRRLLLIPTPTPVVITGGPHCPNCGAAIETGERFCGSCGQSLEEADDPGVMTCSSCGAEIDLDRGPFCPSCGAATGPPSGGGAP
ncbi:MAG: zinc ribbon domain-containing protein [Actinomycetota bacterium]|nr:zinc ribbon domain-containing protein [Actinomycetota bacterium]